jgi:hypothetical protein
MRDVAPPSGQLPPAGVTRGDGSTLALRPLAGRASDRHQGTHAQELERYGPHARDWCVHHLQWLLLWAMQDADGLGVDFGAQVQWLASVLDARGYPLASLADALETLAGEAEEVAAGASGRLRDGAVLVRP